MLVKTMQCITSNYHESCHYQNNNYCLAWRWKRNYMICTHNLKNVTCKLVACSGCKKLQVKMLSSLLSSNLNYSWLLIIMNDNHNCELFMNMKQDMNRDLWLVHYMPLGVERTGDDDDDDFAQIPLTVISQRMPTCNKLGFLETDHLPLP